MASTGSVMNYDITTPNPFAVPPPAATISAETITDAIKSLETSHNVLKIAGAKPDQLASLRTNITGLRKQMASLQEERVRMAKLDKEVFGPGVDDDTGEMVSNPNCMALLQEEKALPDTLTPDTLTPVTLTPDSHSNPFIPRNPPPTPPPASSSTPA